MENATVETTNGALTWQSDGVYLIGHNDWHGMDLHARLAFDGTPIRLIPRYLNRRFYLQITIEHRTTEDEGETPTTVTVIRTEQYQNDRLRLLEETVIDDAWSGELDCAVTTDTHQFRCTINDTTVANLELPGMTYGRMGVYATTGARLYAIAAEGDTPEAWTLNSDPSTGGAAWWERGTNGEPVIVLGTDADASCTLDSVPDGAHVVSIAYRGRGTMHVTVSDGEDQEVTLDSSEWVRAYAVVTSGAASDLTVTSTDTLRLRRVQVEAGTTPHAFVADAQSADHEGSIARLPADGVVAAEEGACSFWLAFPALADADRSERRPVIGTDNDAFVLEASPNQVRASLNGTTMTVDAHLPLDTFVFVYVAWGDNPELRLWDGEESVTTSADTSLSWNDTPDMIHIGYHNDDYLFGLLEDMRWYDTPLPAATITAMAEADDAPDSHPDETVRLDFDYRIAADGSNDVDVTKRPRDGSPVLVETSDGRFLQQVSFVDPDTGMFRTWNEEPITYNRHQGFLDLSFDAVTNGSSTPVLRTESGEIVGDPVRYEDGRWVPTFSPKAKEDHHGVTLYATYHVRDAYTVDPHLDTYDTFRVSLGDHQGHQVRIHHEGSVHHDTALQMNTDLNPLTNTNHEGFLYITDTPMPVTSFRVKASPRTLPASRAATSVVTVEPMDEYGNPTNDCDLDVRAVEGTITAYTDVPSVNLRHQAGQYLYRYRTPLRFEEDTDSTYLNEAIYVTDRRTGYGVQLPMTLLVMDSYPDQDERPSARDERLERQRAEILGVMTDLWGFPQAEWPSSLTDALDLDGDGTISVQDITVLGRLSASEIETLYDTIQASDDT